MLVKTLYKVRKTVVIKVSYIVTKSMKLVLTWLKQYQLSISRALTPILSKSVKLNS